MVFKVNQYHTLGIKSGEPLPFISFQGFSAQPDIATATSGL